MFITPLNDLTYNTTNLTEDSTTGWSVTAGYAVGTIRQLNKKLYQSLDLIHPLCTYIYDNTDPFKPHYTTIAVYGSEVTDNTAVPCVSDTTVVYVVDDGNYYKYKNQTDANIDFTTETLLTPTNFNLLTAPAAYRYSIYNPETTPLKWEDLGYTNKYKCLDKSVSSQTSNNGDIEMSFVVSKADELYLFNLYGTSVDITVTQIDTSSVLLEENIHLQTQIGANWFDYFFSDFKYKDKLFLEIPINFNVKIDIKINNLSGISKVGLVGIGKSIEIGGTLYGSGISMLDFSEKQVNTNGETYLKQGNFKSTNNMTIDVLGGLTDVVCNSLTTFRATPIVFRSKGFDSFILFGVYNKWDILISTPTISRLTIDLESLV